MNLRDLVVDTKSVWVPFDGAKGFEVELAYVPRTEMSKLVESCQTSKFSRSSRQIEKELDTDKFLEKFVNRAVKNWKGLKLKYLEDFLPVEYDEEHADKELPFNPDNAIMLIKESQLFDDWVNAKISDIDTFRR